MGCSWGAASCSGVAAGELGGATVGGGDAAGEGLAGLLQGGVKGVRGTSNSESDELLELKLHELELSVFVSELDSESVHRRLLFGVCSGELPKSSSICAARRSLGEGSSRSWGLPEGSTAFLLQGLL